MVEQALLQALPMVADKAEGEMSKAYVVGSSVGNLIKSGIEKRKADKLTPPMEDTERRNFLSEIQRKRKQLASGLDPLGTDIISSGLAQTQSNILRAGGGNVGATMSGLIGTSLATGEQLNRLVGQNQQAEGMYLQMANQVQSEMADRRYKQMLQLRAEHQAKATQLKKDGMTGLNASIMGAEGQDKSLSQQNDGLFGKIGSALSKNKSNSSYMNDTNIDASAGLNA